MLHLKHCNAFHALPSTECMHALSMYTKDKLPIYIHISLPARAKERVRDRGRKREKEGIGEEKRGKGRAAKKEDKGKKGSLWKRKREKCEEMHAGCICANETGGAKYCYSALMDWGEGS